MDQHAGQRPTGAGTPVETAGEAPPYAAPAAGATDGPLLPAAERDALTTRLQQAMNGFIDGPRGAVEEVDTVFDTLTARLGDLLGERRRTLRTAWHEDAARPGTEDLRLVLLDYRRLVERLLSV
ncbi:hypothetical protein [Streptomyces sp. ISL-11]|uniref:hypothetical protein n=1 Tax=Streptomyces sp. ISL-11 TaxID=2819174 RepID=UPI001BE60556|nr:hypothetical protein [Streptomyces sp. ISL-11]MBT2382966.1 hypothetical protein [Streptomyces sp. ISL-11]